MEGFTLIDGVVALVIVMSALLAYGNTRFSMRELIAIVGWIAACCWRIFLQSSHWSAKYASSASSRTAAVIHHRCFHAGAGDYAGDVSLFRAYPRVTLVSGRF
jgi:membrane protein required for colicin V production